LNSKLSKIISIKPFLIGSCLIGILPFFLLAGIQNTHQKALVMMSSILREVDLPGLDVLVGGASTRHQAIELNQPWIRATALENGNTGGYVEIVNNTDVSIQLVEARIPGVRRVELHTHNMDGGVARMRQVEYIQVPAQSKVSLEPGGLHIMLMGVAEPLTDGSQVPIELIFNNGQVITVQARVLQNPPMGSHSNQQNHRH